MILLGYPVNILKNTVLEFHTNELGNKPSRSTDGAQTGEAGAAKITRNRDRKRREKRGEILKAQHRRITTI